MLLVWEVEWEVLEVDFQQEKVLPVTEALKRLHLLFLLSYFH